MSQIDLLKFTIRDLKESSTLSEVLCLEPAVTNPLRIRSYVENPRAKEEDIVLYVLKNNDQVVAYRSLLSDDIFVANEKIHIAWFSGNYVLPGERRKGYSSRLLKEVEKDWRNRLFFSNFAWPSKYVLDQNEKYTPFCTLEGKRYYFQFGLAELLPPKHSFFKRIQGPLHRTDLLLNTLRRPFKKKLNAKTEWEKIEFPEERDFSFMSEFHSEELFKRGKDEFRWIMEYPWLSGSMEAKEWANNYHFSVYANEFDLSFYRLERKGDILGLMLISIKDGVMYLPYSYLNNEAMESAGECLLNLAAQNDIHHLTVYDEALTQILNNFKRYFLFSKKFKQAFLCNSDLLDQYPQIQRKQIHKGDGDAVFT